MSGAMQPHGTSLQAHVAALPPAIRQHLLQTAVSARSCRAGRAHPSASSYTTVAASFDLDHINCFHMLQGVRDVGLAAAAFAPVHTSWGFVLDLPSVSDLEADAAARLAPAAPGQPPTPSADGSMDGAGPAALHSAAPHGAELQAAHAHMPAAVSSALPPGSPAASQPQFLQHLDASRLFHCPDAVDAMAEAYGVSDAFEGLQVGCMNLTKPALSLPIGLWMLQLAVPAGQVL